MTRIEMVRRLLGEGLSRNTLVNFTDKQLSSLCERMLNEGVTKVATADTKTQDQLKQQKKPFELYEKKKPTTKQLTALDKNKNGKIDKEDFKMLRSKKSPKEEVKENLKGGQTKLDANKNGKIDKEDFKLLKKGKTESKSCSKCGMKNCKCKHSKTEVKEGNSKSKVITKKPGKVVQKSKVAMNLSKLNETNELKNWVKGLAEEKYYPFTSKGEIMELIKVKLYEQPEPDVAEPDVLPDVDPDVNPNRNPDYDPFPNPFDPTEPLNDPNPKMKEMGKKSKISFPHSLTINALKNLNN